MALQNTLSQADFDALNNEIVSLEARLADIRSKLAQMEPRKLADDTPDAFFQLKREQGDILQQVDYIEEQLNRATLSAGADDLSTVAIGNRVNVYNETEDRSHVMDIVATALVNTAAETVTADSPLGQALLGREAGDTVTVETPEGTVTYRILDILEMPYSPQTAE